MWISKRKLKQLEDKIDNLKCLMEGTYCDMCRIWTDSPLRRVKFKNGMFNYSTKYYLVCSTCSRFEFED
jgi:hypothetical protein